MGIKPKKNRGNLLGSIEVADLKVNIQEQKVVNDESASQKTEANVSTVNENVSVSESQPAVVEQSQNQISAQQIPVQPILEQPMIVEQPHIQMPGQYMNGQPIQEQPRTVYAQSHIQMSGQQVPNQSMAAYSQPIGKTFIDPVNNIRYFKQVAGRKRAQLIPGDVDKTISVQLPTTLIARIQNYASANHMSMKEVIGLVLIEKFMK